MCATGLLHTIMFNRALGVVSPMEVESEKGLDLCWVDCNDPNVRHKFTEKLREFEANIQRAGAGAAGGGGTHPQLHTVTLQFFKSFVEQGMFSTTKKKRIWEEWKLPLAINAGAAGSDEAAASADQRRHKLSRELRERMMTILEQVDAKKDHLPEISIRGGVEPVGVTYEWDLILSDSGGGGASRPPSGWAVDIGNIGNMFGAGK